MILNEEDRIIEYLYSIRIISNLFKKPNSLSKINGKLAFKELVKIVK